MDLQSLLQKRKEKGLNKGTIIRTRTKDGVNCVELEQTLYELRTLDGSSVFIIDKDYFAFKTQDNRSVIETKQGGFSFYFKRISDEEISQYEDVKHWYGYHYVIDHDNPEKIKITAPNDLVKYVLNEDEVRPRVDIIEGAINPQLFEILPHLFLGSQDAATNEQGLNEKGVKYILNVATGIDYKQQDGINYCTIPILDLDSVDIIPIFEQCFDFIEIGRKDGGVLVHCNQGVSRSATVIIAYIMKTEKKSFQESYNITKNSKQDINPNPGFMRQLKEYENSVYTKE